VALVYGSLDSIFLVSLVSLQQGSGVQKNSMGQARSYLRKHGRPAASHILVPFDNSTMVSVFSTALWKGACGGWPEHDSKASFAS
jgi:hypothetical protein